MGQFLRVLLPVAFAYDKVRSVQGLAQERFLVIRAWRIRPRIPQGLRGEREAAEEKIQPRPDHRPALASLPKELKRERHRQATTPVWGGGPLCKPSFQGPSRFR